MKKHKFSISDAEKYGIGQAIVLEYLRENQSPKIPFYNSKSYCTLKGEEIKREFPYLSYPSVRRWLNQLEKGKVIESVQPFKKDGDQTKFYHVIEDNEVNNESTQI